LHKLFRNNGRYNIDGLNIPDDNMTDKYVKGKGKVLVKNPD